MKRTPLFEEHQKLGARLTPFGGWEMPLWYSSITDEHLAVRQQAGLFDLCHMGRIRVTGAGAFDLLQYAVTSDMAKLPLWGCKYGLLCAEDGGILDDVLVYKGPDYGFVVVNASNLAVDLEWLRRHAGRFNAVVEDESEKLAMIAAQGPNALGVVQALAPKLDLLSMKYYAFAEGEVDRIKAIVSRTGYTGEDGFEIYLDAAKAAKLWNTLLLTGRSKGLVPVGLGARDTLRLEAAMALYGHEITRQTNPLEAGLGWAVSFDKGDFLGRAALETAKAGGLKRRLVGLEVDRRIPRQGYGVLRDGQPVGEITSGTQSPLTKKNIAMAYVAAGAEPAGTPLSVQVRAETVPAQVVKLPFYKRAKPTPVKQATSG